jgi:hypothetical protein
MVLEALPNEDGALALSDIPRLGEVPVLTPLTLQVATTTVSVQPVATTPAVPLAVAPATIDALPSMRVMELRLFFLENRRLIATFEMSEGFSTLPLPVLAST